jgi:23S rRNA (guanine745-N1)-methyltransferase
VIAIRCTVRDCDRPLAAQGRTWVCPSGHAFDAGRSGHVNLLQPQDRRSTEPGDSAAMVEARSRWIERGLAEELFALVEAWVDELDPAPGSAILDVGCGEGSLLARLAARRDLDPYGVDLSAFALRRAARRGGRGTWLVANADRRLPFFDSSFALVLSIFGRRHAAELRRVLTPGGRLIAAVPAADDLIQLRAAVLGEGRPIDRVERTLAELGSSFQLTRRRTVRRDATLDAAAIADALTMSYRGARSAESTRAKALTTLDVTLSAEVLMGTFSDTPGAT